MHSTSLFNNLIGNGVIACANLAAPSFVGCGRVVARLLGAQQVAGSIPSLGQIFYYLVLGGYRDLDREEHSFQ